MESPSSAKSSSKSSSKSSKSSKGDESDPIEVSAEEKEHEDVSEKSNDSKHNENQQDEESSMSKVERKRLRERKRRNEVNQGFDKLMGILWGIDPDLRELSARRNTASFNNESAAIEDTKPPASFSGAQEVNNISRQDLIFHASKVLEKLHKENEEQKAKITELKKREQIQAQLLSDASSGREDQALGKSMQSRVSNAASSSRRTATGVGSGSDYDRLDRRLSPREELLALSQQQQQQLQLQQKQPHQQQQRQQGGNNLQSTSNLEMERLYARDLERQRRVERRDQLERHAMLERRLREEKEDLLRELASMEATLGLPPTGGAGMDAGMRTGIDAGLRTGVDAGLRTGIDAGMRAARSSGARHRAADPMAPSMDRHLPEDLLQPARKRNRRERPDQQSGTDSLLTPEELRMIMVARGL